MRDRPPWLSNLIMKALDQGREVTLERCEETGFTVAIDGVRIEDPEMVHGLPWETFEYPIGEMDLSDEARTTIEDILGPDAFLTRRQERKREWYDALADVGRIEGYDVTSVAVDRRAVDRIA